MDYEPETKTRIVVSEPDVNKYDQAEIPEHTNGNSDDEDPVEIDDNPSYESTEQVGGDMIQSDYILEEFSKIIGQQINRDDKRAMFNLQAVSGGKWNVPESKLPELFAAINNMYIKKIPHHFAMPQLTFGRIMLDFDILLPDKTQISNNIQMGISLAENVVAEIMSDMDTSDTTANIFVLIMVRNGVTEKDKLFKDGIHLYTNILADKGYKRYLIQKLQKNEKFKRQVFGKFRIQNINEPTFLDSGSASFPPLLIGGSKPGNKTYLFGSLHKIEWNLQGWKDSMTAVLNSSSHNIPAMFSPCYRYDGDQSWVSQPRREVTEECSKLTMMDMKEPSDSIDQDDIAISGYYPMNGVTTGMTGSR
jgi:hypothetical protein